MCGTFFGLGARASRVGTRSGEKQLRAAVQPISQHTQDNTK
jgi:hypothetical protein